ncbi:MAG: hypothetical protein K2X99_08415 [Gemmatimonadaceae bacterium]|nr:hypothetical protein [Gemmatimonadaceae bacterium]
MGSPIIGLGAEVTAIVDEYRHTADVPRLLERLDLVAARATSAEELMLAVKPYLEMHEVAGPIYERVIERDPNNAQALVILANAYWLTGRGGDVVGDLASRALAIDPANRGAWHLWALSEGVPRTRLQRWQQVVARFPDDDLAKATMADNAAGIGASEDDPAAMQLALDTFKELRARATRPEQRNALDEAITALSKRR